MKIDEIIRKIVLEIKVIQEDKAIKQVKQVFKLAILIVFWVLVLGISIGFTLK